MYAAKREKTMNAGPMALNLMLPVESRNTTPNR